MHPGNIDRVMNPLPTAWMIFRFFSPSELGGVLARTSKKFRSQINETESLPKTFDRLFTQLERFAKQGEIADQPNMQKTFFGLFGAPKEISRFPAKEIVDKITEQKPIPLERCRLLGDLLKKPLSDYLDNILSKPLDMGNLHPEAVDLLLKFSASELRIFFKDNGIYDKILRIKNQLTKLLIEASRTNNLEHVGILLTRGADINGFMSIDYKADQYLTVNEVTALMIASILGHVEIVKLLVSLGANVGITTPKGDGWTALNYAYYLEKGAVISVLLAHVNPHKFIQMKVPLGCRRDGALSLLMLAARYCPAETAKFLVEQKVDVHAKVSPEKSTYLGMSSTRVYWCNDYSALTFATMSGSADVVKLLLENKADIEEKVSYEGNEKTPLMIATSANRHQVVKVLLEQKADINARSPSNKWTAIMYGAERASIKTVRLLVEHGANLEGRVNTSWSDKMPVIVGRNSNKKAQAFIRLKLAELANEKEAQSTGLELRDLRAPKLP